MSWLAPALLIAWRLDLLPRGQLASNEAHILPAVAEARADEDSSTEDPINERSNAKVIGEDDGLVDVVGPEADIVPRKESRKEKPQGLGQEEGQRESEEFAEVPVADVVETPEPPQFIRMTLAESVIRVITIPDEIPVNEMLCDIAINETLASPPPVPPAVRVANDVIAIGEGDKLTNLAKGLRLGDRRNLVFGSGIANATVGMEVAVVARGNAVIAELRPNFALPSGDTAVFSISAGSRKLREISRHLERATEAQAALPNLRVKLSRAQRDYRAVAAHAGSAAVVRDTREAAYATLSQQAARERAKHLLRHAAALEQQIARAERLADSVPALRQDLQAIERVSEYSERIRSLGVVSVRFHHDGHTLPAEVR